MGIHEEEEHLAVSFEMHLTEYSLDCFGEEQRNQFCKHVCDTVECDHVGIEKLNDGSVIINAHAVGFFHEDHRKMAADTIHSGEAVKQGVWGAHLVHRPPEHTMSKRPATPHRRGHDRPFPIILDFA